MTAPASPSGCSITLEGFDARRFFFCHLEAVETLIWFSEAPAPERHGRRLRITVEIVEDRGIESLKVIEVAA